MIEIKVKKWLLVLTVCILILALAACSDAKNSEDVSNGVNTVEENMTENNATQLPDNSTENELNKDEPINSNENLNESIENNQSNQDKVEESNEDPMIIILVNKEYELDEDYAPDDLVTVNVPTVLKNPEVNQLREVAADALKIMFDKAENSGVYLHARSGYRSYQTQVQLFQNYSNSHGEEAANRYSARPGQSEHQTGLVMDVTSESVNYQLQESFGETKEGKWLKEHAHEFGFIIRYPKDGEDITGYIYEPWHIRYLGIEMATKVYECGLTYEEYINEEGIIDEVTS